MVSLASPEENGQLVYQAALYNNVHLLGDLLNADCGHQLGWKDANGRTPLHVAAYNGYSKCVQLLVDAGAEVNCRSSAADKFRTPLQLAAHAGHTDTVRILTSAGADVFLQDKDGYCALELSQMAERNDTSCALIDAIDERDTMLKKYQTRLQEAIQSGDVEAAESALQEARPDLLPDLLHGPHDENYTLLYRAAERGHADLVKTLIKHGADGRPHPVTRYSPLYIATYAGHYEVVNILLKEFPELVRCETFEKWLPIHAVAKTGDAQICRLLLTYSYPAYSLSEFTDATGKWHYRFAFDVNHQDEVCRTPLYIACKQGRTEIVRLLLEFSVEAFSSSAGTPDLRSPDLEEIYEDVVFTQSKEKKEANRGDSGESGGEQCGDTPVKKARSRLNFVAPVADSDCQTPQSAGAGKGRKKMRYFTPLVVDVYSSGGRTPLQVATAEGNKEMVRLLVERGGANVNLPLAITDEELAVLNPTGAEFVCAGSGALMEACRTGDADLAALLLAYGAADHDNRALNACLAAGHRQLACKLLCRLVFLDPEFRVNKKGVDAESLQLGRGRTLLPSALYPTAASMLNWHRAGLVDVENAWLFAASLELNPKMVTGMQSLVLAAITRIDISKNKLTTLPISMVQLPSLRVLNASHNDITNLLESSEGVNWYLPVLEELHLHHNKLIEVAEAIFALPNLQALDVSHNHLCSLPSALWFAPKLKDLNLSANKISALPSYLVEDRPSSRSSRASTADALADTSAMSEADSGLSFDRLSLSSSSKQRSGSVRSAASLGADDATPGSVAGMTETGSDGPPQDEHLSVQELTRHNLWQKSVELSRAFDEEEEAMLAAAKESTRKMKVKSLQSLNLSHNLLDRTPECLSCVVPSLTRLNLSFNFLVDMSAPCNYPAKLKHLDLSNNKIRRWFVAPRSAADLSCYCETSDRREARPPHSPTMGRRSHSMVRGNRSVSVVRGGESALTQNVVSACPHKRHHKLENLRSLVVAGNSLHRINITLEPSTGGADEQVSSVRSSRSSRRSVADVSASPSTESPSVTESWRSKTVFPCVSMLDVSLNQLKSICATLSELHSLSVLNLCNNPDLTSLPPELGLLSKLWNLNLNGCNLEDPLKSMLDSKKYKTMDIVGYLKSILEDSKPYARMKLMIVGVQGIGKTSLLEQLRLEGTTVSKKPPTEGWAKRMGNKNINQKTAKGSNISTVGVDLGDWSFEPKKAKGQSNLGSVTFRTWDFGGQREYYATHQYFLSRRSLYLVVWRVTDGEPGIQQIQQWLLNIQARAPNSPCILVGTHFDEILANAKKFPPSFLDDLQQTIRDRFLAIQDADKKGYPRVVDSIVVSSKTRYNIRTLCNLIYTAAFDQRSSGSKERLLEQKIPSTYLALEEVVSSIAEQRKEKGKDPVLTSEQYRSVVQEEMQTRFEKRFRDQAELNQATAFLHENGLLLHYEDATLKELYFLDPQWLCDILAHVITIREINPFAKNGLMRLDDVKILFKSSRFSPTNIRNYILNLLQKFEVAMTWDNRNLIIPCLLPDEYQLRAGYPNSEVKLSGLSKRTMKSTMNVIKFCNIPPCYVGMLQNLVSFIVDFIVRFESPDSFEVPIKSKGWAVPSCSLAKLDPKHVAKSTFYVTDSTNRLDAELRSPQKQSNNTRSTGIELGKEAGCGSTEQLDDISAPVPIFTMKPHSARPAAPQKPYESQWNRIEEECARRLYLMSYIPSGFWSRLITRILGEEHIPAIWDKFFVIATEAAEKSYTSVKALQKLFDTNKPEWLLWQTGVEIQAFGQTLFSVKEFLPHAQVRDVDYSQVHWKCHFEGAWRDLKAEHSSIIEIYVPTGTMHLQYASKEGAQLTEEVLLQSNRTATTQLLAIVVELIDTLLEDWYPSLGTRFVHTSEGKYLVTRIVPCWRCLQFLTESAVVREEKDWAIVPGFDTPPSTEDTDDAVTDRKGAVHKSHTFSITKEAEESSGNKPRSTSYLELQELKKREGLTNCAYSFTIEECILFAHEAKSARCPTHKDLNIDSIAPDIVFLDIKDKHLVLPDQVKRGKMLGRGAFGFVFKATIQLEGKKHLDVALKMLQPVDPGFGAKTSAATAYKAAWAKWQREPAQYCCKAYCTARQELNVLTHLKHNNIVPLVGVCPRPLALVVALAPLGALSSLLHNYKRSGAKLLLTVLQETLQQVSRGLEYLHQQHIIYRDLKSENVLVWQFPPPFSTINTVDLKLGDYGISRSVFPAGGAKGFGGTEGFMAPEIMRYNGEEEYTEKVDCFSYAMFLYELLSFKMPFEGQEQVKEFILDGGRPQLSPSELLYPCNVLDLMVVSWAGRPEDRPSSSQLVSITTAPEFSHLLDVVSLTDSDAAVISGETFTVDDGSLTSPVGGAGGMNGNGDDCVDVHTEGELWLSRADGQMSVLTCNQHGWLDYKNIYVNEDSFVTAMCLVEDTVWLGELTGIIRVFCAKTYCELYSFPLAPHVLAKERDGAKHQLSLAVASILSLSSLKLVLVATGQPGALLLCRMIDNLGGDGADPVIAVFPVNTREVHSVAALPPVAGKVEVWVGQSCGYVSTFVASGESLSQSTTVNHYEPPLEGVEVFKLIASQSDNRYIWSYVFPGSILYQWNTRKKAIVAKLDCSKIAPCSESISTMNIDEKMSPGRCQVTAMSLLEKEDSAYLYLGTTWGVVIVAEADQLKPVTAFRTHLEDIRVVMPIDPSKRPVMFQQDVSPTHHEKETSPASERSSFSTVASTQGSKVSQILEKLYRSARGQSTNSKQEFGRKSVTNRECFIITVGKGYRCLIQRFLDNYREDEKVLDSRNKDFFAAIWRTDDWLVN